MNKLFNRIHPLFEQGYRYSNKSTEREPAETPIDQHQIYDRLCSCSHIVIHPFSSLPNPFMDDV